MPSQKVGVLTPVIATTDTMPSTMVPLRSAARMPSGMAISAAIVSAISASSMVAGSRSRMS